MFLRRRGGAVAGRRAHGGGNTCGGSSACLGMAVCGGPGGSGRWHLCGRRRTCRGWLLCRWRWRGRCRGARCGPAGGPWRNDGTGGLRLDGSVGGGHRTVGDCCPGLQWNITSRRFPRRFCSAGSLGPAGCRSRLPGGRPRCGSRHGRCGRPRALLRRLCGARRGGGALLPAPLRARLEGAARAGGPAAGARGRADKVHHEASQLRGQLGGRRLRRSRRPGRSGLGCRRSLVRRHALEDAGDRSASCAVCA